MIAVCLVVDLVWLLVRFVSVLLFALGGRVWCCLFNSYLYDLAVVGCCLGLVGCRCWAFG